MAEMTSKKTAKKVAPKPSPAGSKPVAKKPAARAKTTAKPAAKKAAAPVKPGSAKVATPTPVARTASKAMQVSDEQRYRMVAEAAYYRAESNQFKSDPVRDWIEAEADITALLSGSK